MKYSRILCWSLAFAVGIVSVEAQTPKPVNSPAATQSAAAGKTPPEVEKAMQMPEGKEKTDALGSAIKAWAQKDPIAGLAWMASLTPNVYAKVRTCAGAYAQGADPKKSVDWIVQQSSPAASDLLHLVSATWGRLDPAAAGAWCVQLQSKDVHMREVSFFSVADGICRKKSEQAAAWVAQLPPGEDRRSAVGGTVLIWARGNIVAATAWIKTLGLPDQKWAAQTIVGAWGSVKGTKDAPNAWQNAQEWLDQLPFTPSDKEYILKNPRR